MVRLASPGWPAGQARQDGARTSTPATRRSIFFAIAPAATRPIVSLAEDRPPPATCMSSLRQPRSCHERCLKPRGSSRALPLQALVPASDATPSLLLSCGVRTARMPYFMSYVASAWLGR